MNDICSGQKEFFSVVGSFVFKYCLEKPYTSNK
jgi:hypothetical protein